jgi:DNA-binding transcriptional MerR regulator
MVYHIHQRQEMMHYTINQLAKIAGVTRRALRYYDEIGLLRLAAYGENGYRYYDEDAALRLQQILFFRELELPLEEIRAILDQPGFDMITALHSHRKALQARANRIERLVETIDHTIQHLQGERQMTAQDFYQGFDEEQQQVYADEAQRRWGQSAADSQERWKAMTRTEKNDFLARMHEISAQLAARMDQGPESSEVQNWIRRWHEHIDQFCYPCSLEMFEALGHLYVEDPAFTASYEKTRQGMAAFMEKAMVYYCRVQASRG